jgi:UDPglucose 6-dehydrogenase
MDDLLNYQRKINENLEKELIMPEKLKIGIFGIGMVGRPLMDWFLSKGWVRGRDLFCYDIDPKKVFRDDAKNKADIIFICVPTPSDSDGSCDLSAVEGVIRKLPDRPERCIVIKSTVTPGATEYLNKKFKSKGAFLFNPEFLTEAQAHIDFVRPDRQVVAAPDEEAEKWLSVVLNILPLGSFQLPGIDGTYKQLSVNSTEAEFGKYGGNLFGSMKVTYANVLNVFCEAMGIDYENVRLMVSHDRRIGDSYMDVSHGQYKGYGGFCFPKDTNALIAFGEYLIKRLDKEKRVELKEVLEAAVDFLKSICKFNRALLKSQGLTEDDVSIHDEELKKKIKKIKRGDK